jgi:group I intron endonuclease
VIEQCCYIYKITNIVNNKCYIGKTGLTTIIERWKEHCRMADNGADYYFHRAIRKYGKEAFGVKILKKFEYHDSRKLNHAERYFIKKYKSNDPRYGYNMTEGGDGLTNPVPEVRKKIGKANQGNKYCVGFHHTKETRKNMSKANQGRKDSEETKRKKSESNKGKHVFSEEARKKLSADHLGKHPSKKTRKKLSEARKGKPLKCKICEWCNKTVDVGNYAQYHGIKCHSNPDTTHHYNTKHTSESKQKMSEIHKGKKASKKARKKMSQSAKLRWERRRISIV